MRSDHLLPLRFIPADAGNTQPEQQGCALKTAYPRWRGEHVFGGEKRNRVCGLSPLARGTRLDADIVTYSGRFIPAGAGNTRLLQRLYQLSTVYPRWRGEHYCRRPYLGTRDGLSPLARGTLLLQNVHEWSGRFIPAGAGNTSRMLTRWPGWPVYPRWRGEHDLVAHRFAEVGGLSPLARGTPGRSPADTVGARFIPAGAGNTVCVRLPPCRNAVYPRWRGEHESSVLHTGDFFGLSPLARGTPRREPPARWPRRFIPAGAGNT